MSESPLKDVFRRPGAADFDPMSGLEEECEVLELPAEVSDTLPTPAPRPIGVDIPMHGRSATPRIPLQREQAWHRQAAYLIAVGLTQLQVAQALGKSQAAMSILFSQPWFQANVSQLIGEQRAADGAYTILKNAAPAAALKMVEMAAGGQGVNAQTQFRALDSILNRVLGPIGRERAQSNGDGENSLAEVEALQQQLESIDEQIRIL